MQQNIPLLISEALLLLSEHESRTGDEAAALEMAEHALAICDSGVASEASAIRRAELATQLSEIGVRFSELHADDRATAASESSVHILEPLIASMPVLTVDYMRSLNNLACDYIIQQRTNEATLAINQAIDLSENADNNTTENALDRITMLANSSQIEFTSGNPSNAIAKAEKAECILHEIATKCPLDVAISSAIINTILGSLHAAQKNHTEAERYSVEAKNVVTSHASSDNPTVAEVELVVRSNLARRLVESGKAEEAQKELETAILVRRNAPRATRTDQTLAASLEYLAAHVRPSNFERANALSEEAEVVRRARHGSTDSILFRHSERLQGISFRRKALINCGLIGIQFLSMKRDGSVLCACGAGRLIHFFDTHSGQRLNRELLWHSASPIMSASMALQGDRFATMGSDGFVKLWDLDNFRYSSELRTSRAEYSKYRALALSPSGVSLAVGGEMEGVELYDISGGKPAHWRSMSIGPAKFLLNRLETTTLIVCDSTVIRGVHLDNDANNSGTELFRINVAVSHIRASTDLRTIVAVLETGEVCAWRDLEVVWRSSRIGIPQTIIDLSSDGRFLIYSSSNTAISLIDLIEGKPVAVWEYKSNFSAACISPDGMSVALAAGDQVEIWSGVGIEKRTSV